MSRAPKEPGVDRDDPPRALPVDGSPTFRRAPLSASRRAVLLGSAGAAALCGLAACDGADNEPSVQSIPSSSLTGGLGELALIAALENLTVAVYEEGLERVVGGKLGNAPSTVAALMESARQQHVNHAAEWNRLLSAAGRTTLTGAPLAMTGTTMSALRKCRSVVDVMTLMRELETLAAQTYTSFIGKFGDPIWLTAAATIQPVEHMHAAALSFLLGTEVAPVSFTSIDRALNQDELVVR